MTATRCGVTPAFAQLLRECERRATGELIFASPGVEVHLYLQAGRVAWGTTSEARFLFRRYLDEVLRIDAEALSTVLAECRRLGKPLGEALVAWELATFEQVRTGLRAQVLAALTSLRGAAGGQSLFLPRGLSWASYDPRLTFELSELCGDAEVRAGDASFEALCAAVPGHRWVAQVHERTVEREAGEGAATLALALDARLGGEVGLLAVRSSEGNVAGALLPEGGRSLWCRVDEEAALTAGLHHLTQLVRLERGLPHACARGEFDFFGESSLPVDDISLALVDAGCPVGAVVIERTGAQELWACARAPLSCEALGQWGLMRQRVLDADFFATRGRERELAWQAALVGDARWCWFGADVPGVAASLWVVLPRAAAQELGWALSTALSRRLAEGRDA